MASCKDLRRQAASAIKEEREALRAVRTANAAVTAAVRALPGPYTGTPAADVAAREAIKPLVAMAQEASNRWFQANAEVVNARMAVGMRCTRKGGRTS